MTLLAPSADVGAPAAQVRQEHGSIPVWLPPLVFGLVTAVLLAAGRGAIVRLAFPVGGLAIGCWLYARGIGPYLAFTWMLWQVSPGIRRIVDYQLGGLEPQNPMSLTPFLVSAIALLEVIRRLPSLRRGRLLPWAVAAVCIAYGYAVGLLRLGLMAATHGLISWMVPLGFGLYCALEWRRYPEIRGAFQVAFLSGAIVLGAYGILQFVDPPAWDRLWMMDSGMYSIGRAFPYEVRVFSLVNAPLPFATVLVAGLFVALSIRGALRMVALSVGTMALLLSLVRSVWLAGAVGLVVYLVSLPIRTLRRVVLAGAATVALMIAVPLVAPRHITEPTIQILSNRFATFTELDRDASFKDRTRFLDTVAGIVAESPWGRGLGSTGVSSMLAEPGSGIRDFDNGVFAVLYSLGWLAGGGLLLSAVVVAGLPFHRRAGRADAIASVARAVTVTSLVLILGANIMEGVSAATFWGFAGLAAAARSYHRAREGVA